MNEFTDRSRLSFYCSKSWLKTRAKVLARDNYTCKICGLYCRGKGLNVVDHIKPRLKFPALAYELTNLITVCRKCHDSTCRKKDNAKGCNSLGFSEGWN